MTPIKAVLFDFGQVLSLPADPLVWQQMVAISRLPDADLYREYWAYRHEYDRGTYTGLSYWQQIATSTGTALTPAQIADLIAADVNLWSRLNTPMVEWAARLQRARIRTGILSNIGDAMAQGLRAKFDWIGGFDHCVWSYALKLAKPEAAIYRAAAEGLATDPAAILFIDDKAENIEAAHAAGMQAIQYGTHEDFEREMRLQGFEELLHPVATG